MHSPCVTELRNECSICGRCEGMLVLCVIAAQAVVQAHNDILRKKKMSLGDKKITRMSMSRYSVSLVSTALVSDTSTQAVFAHTLSQSRD